MQAMVFELLFAGKNELMTSPLPAIEIDIPEPPEDGDEIDFVNYFSGFISDDIGEFTGELLPPLNPDTKDGRVSCTHSAILVHHGITAHSYKR